MASEGSLTSSPFSDPAPAQCRVPAAAASGPTPARHWHLRRVPPARRVHRGTRRRRQQRLALPLGSLRPLSIRLCAIAAKALSPKDRPSPFHAATTPAVISPRLPLFSPSLAQDANRSTPSPQSVVFAQHGAPLWFPPLPSQGGLFARPPYLRPPRTYNPIAKGTPKSSIMLILRNS